MTGTLKELFYDFEKKSTVLILALDGNVRDDLAPLLRQKISAEIKKWRQKRSLNANAYYWVLVGKLAKKNNLDNVQLHNQLLRRYSEPWIGKDGNLMTWYIPAEVDIDHMEAEHFSILETDVWIEGRKYIKVCLLVPSHLMDTKQMSRLIDGVVGECKEAGIETIPPEELERMLSSWRPYEKSTKRNSTTV